MLDISLHLEILYPLGAAWLAGSLIGLEREYHGRPAGFRTHALVCLASALLTVLMTQEWDWLDILPLEAIRADPTRVVEAIMTGIGFLGAGVIFREGLAVRGLTTAASIWITAVLGILFGVGYWIPAIAGTGAVLVTLAVFQPLEEKLPGKYYVEQVLRFPSDQIPSRAELRGLMADHGFAIVKIRHALVDGGESYEYCLTTTTRKMANVEELATALRSWPGIREFSIAPRGD